MKVAHLRKAAEEQMARQNYGKAADRSVPVRAFALIRH
jgi:hypothetical protein